MLSSYTTPADIRAILGVNSQELTDSTLSSRVYFTVIQLGLEDVSIGIPALFDTISALPVGSRTAQQARFFDLVTLYAPYLAAKQLLISLPMFGVLSITDGRATFERQKDAYIPVMEGVDGMLQAISLRLAIAYNALAPGAGALTESPTFSTMLISTLSTDPVTNA